MSKDTVYQKILQVGEALIQKVGFQGFSYKDIAQQVGIKTSSIHYYFPSKKDLGREIMVHHRERMELWLQSLLSGPATCHSKLVTYLEGIFSSTYQNERKMCLGGMFAVNVLNLEPEIQEEVKTFFLMNERFLRQLLQMGQEKQEFTLQSDPLVASQNILALVEGGLLLARLYQDDARLKGIQEQILKLVL